MYLSKKQEKSIIIALDALDAGLRVGIQEEDSQFARDTLCEMLDKGRAERKKRERLNKNNRNGL